jgi:hypothetical protein
MALCKDKTTGQLVEFISTHGESFAQVRNRDGYVTYPLLTNLEFYDPGTGGTGAGPEAPPLASVDPLIPEGGVIPMDVRLNLNTATAEAMTAIRGIGYATAKKIIELRASLPGDRFRSLDQLKSIPRVDWEEVIKDDQIYVA